MDHNYIGFYYTWTNRQGATFQARKLDRAMVNDAWLDMGMDSIVEILNPGVSYSSCCCNKETS